MSLARRYIAALPVEVSGFPPARMAAPAFVLAGQSNAGYLDNVLGTTDPRVSFTWGSMYSTVVDGPGPQRLVTPFTGSGSGHSFEWQAATDLATHFDSAIIAGKFWADGSIVQYFLPSYGIYWSKMSAVLESVASQCVAAGVTRVELAWCQGESNANAALPAELAAYEADTSTLFDLIKALFAAHGLTTHFTIIKTNIHVYAPGDANTPALVTVRDAQEHLALVRDDTEIVSLDDLTTYVTLHYGFGQTNTGGSRVVTSILTRY
jgi:hypothetical protein